MPKPIFWTAIALLALCAPFRANAALPPQVGGKATIGITEAARFLDPLYAETPGERQIAGLIAEPLLAWDGRTLLPRLALRWQEEDGGAAFRIWLDPKILFHDGAPLTAADVRATLERAILAKRPASWSDGLLRIRGAAALRDGRAKALAGFEEISRVEFAIRLERAEQAFPRLLADPALAILPVRQTAQRTPIARPIGAGPFVLQEGGGETVQLKAYEMHHAGRPYLDELVFRAYSSPPTERKALEKGAIDGMLFGRANALAGGMTAAGLLGLAATLRPVSPRALQKAAALGAFWRALCDCETIVKLFEKRRRTPFPSEPAMNVVTAGAGIDSIAQAIERSCLDFRPDRAAAIKHFKALGFSTPLTVAVRENQAELKLVAERLALAAQEWGLTVSVRELGESDPDSGGDWDAVLTLEPVYQPFSVSAGSSSVHLYHLLPRLVWRNDRLSAASFDVWSMADLASVYWRLP